MRLFRCLVAAGLVLGLLAGAARAQDDERNRLREELIQKLDQKLEKLREEMIKEIDRSLEGRRRPTRPGPAPDRTVPAPAGDGAPFLGVTLKPLSEGARTLLDLPEGIGVMVDEVHAGSAAEKAGLVAGDVILTWNGKDVADAEALGGLVRGSKVGDEVEIGILHRGAKKTVEAVLGGRPVEPEPEAEAPEPEVEPRRGEESLEQFLERVLKGRRGEDEGEEGEGEGQKPPLFFGGNPEDLQKMLEKMFSDPEAMKEMQKQAEELMKQLFGGDPEKMKEFQKQAEEQMRQLFGGEGGQGGPGGEDLEKMFERMMGRSGEEGEEPERKEDMDRLNQLLDEVLKGAKDEKKEEGAPAETPKKGFLGISLSPISPAVRSQMNIEEGTGLLVAGVLEGSPAAEAGVLRSDIIVSIDGQKVGSGEDVAGIMSGRKAGDEVTLGIVRKGTKIELEATLGEAK